MIDLENTRFQKGVKVAIIYGKYIGRTGIIKRRGSVVFPEYCRVSIDLTKIEKSEKIKMIEYINLELN